MKIRTEHDTMGIVEVPADKYWGAQTQRSFNNFKIGTKMPIELIYAFACLKKACALANRDFDKITEKQAQLISKVCDEIIAGELDDNFPLVVWQTGSGTQTNMNLNEVIANRSQIINGGSLSDKERVLHPNDDVNKSQSSNDTFPSVINIASKKLVISELMPAIKELMSAIDAKIIEFGDVVKVGRTHMMDATPISFGQEFSGYKSQLEHSLKAVENTLTHLSELPIGGTAVGTGLNAPKGFDVSVVKYLNQNTDLGFKVSDNKFEGLASNDAIVETHGALKQLAVSLNKIANDLRLMASGPRCGIGEIVLPANEPGSSIMPGKVNPTQIEALVMVCAQVIGNDVAITTGAMNGQFELNVYKPLIAKNFVESANLLSQSIKSFANNCVNGLKLNEEQIEKYLDESLMNVTALNEKIGDENAAKIAKYAFENSISLRQAATETKIISPKDFDKYVNPNRLI